MIALGACTVFLDPNNEQCATNADCTSRGPAFEGTFCSDRKVCEGDRAYCKSNSDCITRKGAPNYICVLPDHRCVDVLSPECSGLKGDLTDDHVVILGTLLSPKTQPFFLACNNSVELAREDFMNTASGLPGSQGSGRRSIAVVSCDPAPGSPALVTAATHLVKDVHVAGIVGPIGSPDVLAVAQNVAIPNKTVLITPSGTSNLLTNLTGRQGLLFRLGALDAETAKAQSLLVSGFVEPTLHARGVVPAGGNLKLAVFHAGTSFGLGVANQLFSLLNYNGKTPAQNGDMYYKDITYGDPAAGDASAQQAAAVVDLVNFNPDIVMISGNLEAGTIWRDLILPKESSSFKPFYIHPVADYVDVLKAIPNDDVRKRVMGTVSGPSQTDTNYSQYLTRYPSVFHTEGTPLTLSAASFDAAYLILDGVAANGDNPLTGDNIGKAIGRLMPPGDPIAAGPEGINPAFQDLASGRNVDFTGVSGPIDFDQNGDVETDLIVWCADPNLSLPNRYRESGLYYEAKSHSLKGTQSCSF